MKYYHINKNIKGAKRILMHIKEIKKFDGTSTLPATVKLVKMLYCKKKYGISTPDFMNYPWLVEPKYLDTYVSFPRFLEFSFTINDQSKKAIVTAKQLLLKRLGDLIERDWMYLEDASDEEVAAFFEKNKHVCIKQNWKRKSEGICCARVLEGGILTFDGDNAPKDIKLSDIREVFGNDTIVEEYVVQHPYISQIYPNCVNTLRIHTLMVNGYSEAIWQCRMRFGSGSAATDADDSYQLLIDVNTGKFTGFEGKTGAKVHADSGFEFANFEVPFFEEAKKLCCEAHKLVPELRFIGWDVAFTENGPTIIEGNINPETYVINQHYFLETKHRGLWPEEKNILAVTKFREALTEESIARINSILFQERGDVDYSDCKKVVVLGSSNCGYRVKHALEVFKDRGDVEYILCGGNMYYGSAEPMTEARFMKKLLVEAGISEDRITVEDDSTNTRENFHSLSKLITGDEKVAIVSAAFHMNRVKTLSKEYGLNSKFVPAYGPNTREDNWFKSQNGAYAIFAELKANDLLNLETYELK